MSKSLNDRRWQTRVESALLALDVVIIRQGDVIALRMLTLNQLEYDVWGIKNHARGKSCSKSITVCLIDRCDGHYCLMGC